MLRHLDFASLALFRSICAAGSVTRGALDYGLAIGAASRRVSELEKFVGVRLLVRGKFGVRPTSAGVALLEHVQRLVAEADRLEFSLADFRLGIDTRVRVWANTSAVNGFLPARIVAFNRTHPSVRIELDEAFSDAIVRAVFEGQAQIGVFAGTTPAWGLHTAVCDTHRLVAISLPTHPIARQPRIRFTTMLDYEFVGLTQGTALQNQLTAEAARLGKPLRLRLQVRSYDAVCKIVSVGMGVSLVPEQVATLLAGSLELATTTLDEPWATRHLVAAVRSLDLLTPAARAFLASMTSQPEASRAQQ